ncbi:MAG: hypothetical protein ACKV19_21950 [Verrucomicrobiales bacterium]
MNEPSVPDTVSSHSNPPAPESPNPTSNGVEGGSAPPATRSSESGPGGEASSPGEGIKKKRPRHRGGRTRPKRFGPGESGTEADADEADEEEDETGAAVETDEATSPGGGSAEVVSAEAGAADSPAAVREPREQREPREPREPRREPREPRPHERVPRPDPRPPRHERPESRGPQGQGRPERFERPERLDRTPLDPRELSEKAWQLFFGELREEGLALIDETDAEKLSNRCFKLAEIFMRQRQRRINQLTSTGTTVTDDRRGFGPAELRPPPPPRPKPEIPIEQRLPDDPTRLSKEEAEALIEEAQEVAEKKAEADASDLETGAGVDSPAPVEAPAASPEAAPSEVISTNQGEESAAPPTEGTSA